MKEDLDLLQVLRYSPLATAVYDSADLRIAFANDAMLKMWCVKADIVGKQFSDVFPSFKNEGFASILENVWRSGITYNATETPAIIVDGAEKQTRYFDFEYKALVNAAGQTYAILHTATDVTDCRLATNQLHTQQEQLAFNYDLETLTHTLSHDIMNPLSTAKMGIAFLQRHIDAPLDNISKWYETISLALHHVENMISQTTKLSEARSIANITQINDLTFQIPLWCEEAKIVFDNPDCEVNLGELLPIYGDIGAIHQIFSNIICNAIKYTANTPHPKVDVYSEKIDKGTVYFIADNGAGIPPSKLDKVFCVFPSENKAVKRKAKGIGLCLTKRIIERYSGTVNVSSQQGKGTVVRLYFPDQKI